MLYIIGGVARSGKSLLAKRILKEKQVPFFPLDGLVGMLQNSAPEHGVRHHIPFIEKIENTGKFGKPLFKYLLKTQESYTVEGDCIDPKDIAEIQEKYGEYIKCCFMGYCLLSAKEKLDLIRTFNMGEKDWTNKHEDEEMLEMLQRMIDHSVYLKSECEKYNIPFFDVSHDFQKTQDEAFDFLVG